MIPRGLFTEIVIILLATGIIFTYIQPTFDEITKTQEDIMLFRTESEKISAVNEQLSDLVAQVESISSEDRRKLLTYLPDTVDTVDIPRTLSFMAEDAGVILGQVSYVGVNKKSPEADAEAPVSHEFSMDVSGTYEQIKNLLSMMERNEYPLEIRSLSISTQEGGFLNAQLQITTYSQYEPEASTLTSNNRKR